MIFPFTSNYKIKSPSLDDPALGDNLIVAPLLK
jgi:hypothetical protein